MRTAVVSLALFSIVAACSQGAQQGGAQATSETGAMAAVDYNAALATTRDAFTRAFNASDTAALSALYTQDAEQMPPNAPAIRGAHEIAAGAAQMFSMMGKPQLTLTPETTEGAGDVAWETGTATINGTMNGKPVQDVSKYLVIVRKQPDGSWKLHREIWNSSAPQTMAPAGK